MGTANLEPLCCGMLNSTPTLRGPHATLMPLDPVLHAPGLFETTSYDTFRYFPGGPQAWNLEAFTGFLASHTASPRTRAFVVIAGTDQFVGSTAYLDIDPVNRAVEIGSTWYTPAVRGTMINPQCKLLMLAHAFEALGCVRVTLKCDARNTHSQRAIAKLGAVKEGVLRRHRIMPDGFIRDTVYFGVTLEEWPTIRDNLRLRIGADPVHSDHDATH